jgi:plasmid stability protein
VSSRNITFNLPDDIIRAAKIYAAEHDTTVNAFVRELLNEKLTADGRSRAAANRLLEIAERGPYFATDLASIRREELHERR